MKNERQYKDSAMIVFYGFIIGWVMFLICALTSS